jgi:hypothetical protein
LSGIADYTGNKNDVILVSVMSLFFETLLGLCLVLLLGIGIILFNGNCSEQQDVSAKGLCSATLAL